MTSKHWSWKLEELPSLWDFPVAQMAKNLPAVQGTQIQSLGQEDPLDKRMATHSNILDWNPMDRGAWRAAVRGVAKSWARLSD